MMTRKEIEEKVNEFLINEFEIEKEKIYPDALLKEQGRRSIIMTPFE